MSLLCESPLSNENSSRSSRRAALGSFAGIAGAPHTRARRRRVDAGHIVPGPPEFSSARTGQTATSMETAGRCRERASDNARINRDGPRSSYRMRLAPPRAPTRSPPQRTPSWPRQERSHERRKRRKWAWVILEEPASSSSKARLSQHKKYLHLTLSISGRIMMRCEEKSPRTCTRRPWNWIR
jgi:hypothetical protein